MKVDLKIITKTFEDIKEHAEKDESVLFVCEGFNSRYGFGEDEKRRSDEWIAKCVEVAHALGAKECSFVKQSSSEWDDSEAFEEERKVDARVTFTFSVEVECYEGASDDEIVELAIDTMGSRSAYDMLKGAMTSVKTLGTAKS